MRSMSSPASNSRCSPAFRLSQRRIVTFTWNTNPANVACASRRGFETKVIRVAQFYSASISGPEGSTSNWINQGGIAERCLPAQHGLGVAVFSQLFLLGIGVASEFIGQLNRLESS